MTNKYSTDPEFLIAVQECAGAYVKAATIDYQKSLIGAPVHPPTAPGLFAHRSARMREIRAKLDSEGDEDEARKRAHIGAGADFVEAKHNKSRPLVEDPPLKPSALEESSLGDATIKAEDLLTRDYVAGTWSGPPDTFPDDAPTPDYHPISAPQVKPDAPVQQSAHNQSSGPLAAPTMWPTAQQTGMQGPQAAQLGKPATKPSLFITTPTIGGLKANYFISAVKMMNEFNSRKQHLSFMPHEGNSLIQAARNVCIREFMKHGASHALLADDDIGWEPEYAIRAMESGYDFCAGAVPLRRTNWEAVNHVVKNCGIKDNLERFGVRYNVNILKSGQAMAEQNSVEIKTSDNSMAVAFAGTAWLVVSRAAIQKMIDNADKIGLKWYYDVQGNNDKTWDFFDPIIDENHELNGEDVSFCKRWKMLGGEIRCWPDMTFSHHGPITLSGNFMSALVMQKDLPK